MKIESRTVGDVAVFEIDGAFAREERCHPSLEELVKARLEGGARKILIDMQRSAPLGDVAVGDVLAAYISTTNAGGKLRVVLSKEGFIMYHRTMVDRFIEVYDSVESALESFAK